MGDFCFALARLHMPIKNGRAPFRITEKKSLPNWQESESGPECYPNQMLDVQSLVKVPAQVLHMQPERNIFLNEFDIAYSPDRTCLCVRQTFFLLQSVFGAIFQAVPSEASASLIYRRRSVAASQHL